LLQLGSKLNPAGTAGWLEAGGALELEDCESEPLPEEFPLSLELAAAAPLELELVDPLEFELVTPP
jgi:hypothetical protein